MMERRLELRLPAFWPKSMYREHDMRHFMKTVSICWGLGLRLGRICVFFFFFFCKTLHLTSYPPDQAAYPETIQKNAARVFSTPVMRITFGTTWVLVSLALTQNDIARLNSFFLLACFSNAAAPPI